MGKPESVCGCSFPVFLTIIILITTLVAAGITLAIILPVLIYNEGGSGMGKAVANSQITFLQVEFSNFRPNVVAVRNVIQLNGGGGYDATLLAADLVMYYNNSVLGRIRTPDIFIKAYTPVTIIDFTQDLYLENVELARTVAYRAISLEEEITVRLIGYLDTKVKILGSKHNLNHIWFDKSAPLPRLQLTELSVFNATQFNGTENELTFKGTTAFTNLAPLSGYNLGDFLMEIYSMPENILIGTAVQPSFTLVEGNNSDIAIVTAKKTPQNIDIINRFFSNYAMGVSQYVMMRGPVNNDTIPSYLIRTIEKKVNVIGTTLGPLLLNSTIPARYGVVHTAFNPLDTSVLMRRVSGVAYTSLRVAYQNAEPVVNCSFATNFLSNLVTGDPATGTEVREMPIPIAPLGTAKLPMVPVIQNHSAPTASELCGVNRLTLLVCKFLNNPISTYLTANFELRVGNFTVNVAYKQDYLGLYLALPLPIVKAVLCAHEPGTDIVLSNDLRP
eukprot:TRINITY_DN6526_c0_g2_i1.p1 TRINITY_DN6526_c0_g2~~TRINITY_DN6526_c0_g2_i1.p1  ORF type:complete len:502 (-),score=77.93 TRINITY_DN6526_c0_g2_i1:248-1753(-)